MRIVIDMQGAQTESRLRGIGRCTLPLAKAIARNRNDHEIILALSGLFPDTIEPIRTAFAGLLAQENIRVWYAPGPVKECKPGNEERRKVAELIREAFLVSLSPDVVFIPSLFEGYEDNGVSSIGVFAKNLTTVVAIDSLGSVRSGDVKSRQIHTLRKIEYLKRADLVLALPPLTADTVCQNIELTKERIKTCLTAEGVDAGQEKVAAEAGDLIKIFEELKTDPPQSIRLPLVQRPKLAYISPLPPERSGISDYSAELIPELARYYDIDVIVAQPEISTPWIIANCGVRTVDWFLRNAQRYDRVLYHFGNSPYHQHMFGLLAQVPGVVVLHDFYLGDIQYIRGTHESSPASHTWTRALYDSHGYSAVVERFRTSNVVDIIRNYPVNFDVLRQAEGVIVHSEYSRHLAREWYGSEFSADWAVIPLLRGPIPKIDKAQARRRLGLKSDDFVVCSFGLLGPAKLNHSLLQAWINSALAQDSRCTLIFVGENHAGDYGVQLHETIRTNGLSKRVRITGWMDMADFRNYLSASDMAVQLRTLSRGETSAAVLDCMNHALPTIVNANGSIADLPSDTVLALPDAFEDRQLIEALETLWQDSERRNELGKRAQKYILARHAPHICAGQYAEAIERFRAKAGNNIPGLLDAIAELEGHRIADAECLAIAQSISQTLLDTKSARQLLVDVSATCRDDLKTGIQRVVRALVWELIQSPPSGYRVEPVYLTDERGVWHYRYARGWTSSILDCPGDWLPDDPVEFNAGDLLLVADYTAGFVVEGERAGVYKQLRNHGVGLHFVVYDLLPIQMPEVFPPGQFGFQEWVDAVCRIADGVICISRSVANELRLWLEVLAPRRMHPTNIDWFHLGADVDNSAPTYGMPDDSGQLLSGFKAANTFLMVGTIEPRKGYLQTLEAFSLLWKEGFDINLVIVGKEGWKGLPNNMRRTIPKIVTRLHNHPEIGRHLFWLEGISDEFLEKIYRASTCLIAASEGEGFGLPLIEAAQHKLPIIARDIPVFREVAGEHAHYFSGLEPQALADAIKQWLELNSEGKAPQSDDMPWLTWRQSTQQLLAAILPNEDILKNKEILN